MRDPSTDIRVAIVEKINNEAIFPISIYDTQAPDDGLFPRVIIQSVTKGTDRRTKCGFGADWNIQLKISARFNGRINSKEVEDISNEILYLLVPLETSAYPVLTNFKIWNANGSVLSDLDYEDGSAKYKDKNIQITYSLTEN